MPFRQFLDELAADACGLFNKSASEAPAGSGGVIFLPWLNGALVPSEDPKLVKIKKVYEPDESKRMVYDHIYAQYRRFFKRNRKIFKALNSQD